LYSFGFFSIELLKAFIEKSYSDIYSKHDYIYLRPDISTTKLIRSVFDEQEVWSIDELFGRLPFLKTETIKHIISSDEYIRIDTDIYVHKDNM
jgi:hypothetical protein